MSAERRSLRSTITPQAIPPSAPTTPPIAAAMSIPVATAAAAGSLDRNRVALLCAVEDLRATTDRRGTAAGATVRNRRVAAALGATQAIAAGPVQIADSAANGS